MTTVMRRINIISRAQGVYRADMLRESGLSACHHSYVLAICNHPGLSQEELARHICINKSNVARALMHLEAHGFVERRQSERDRRLFCVYPTARMLAVLPAVQAITEDWNDHLTEGLSEQEITAFYATLEKMTARAQQYVAEREEINE